MCVYKSVGSYFFMVITECIMVLKGVVLLVNYQVLVSPKKQCKNAPESASCTWQRNNWNNFPSICELCVHFTFYSNQCENNNNLQINDPFCFQQMQKSGLAGQWVCAKDLELRPSTGAFLLPCLVNIQLRRNYKNPTINQNIA